MALGQRGGQARTAAVGPVVTPRDPGAAGSAGPGVGLRVVAFESEATVLDAHPLLIGSGATDTLVLPGRAANELLLIDRLFALVPGTYWASSATGELPQFWIMRTDQKVPPPKLVDVLALHELVAYDNGHAVLDITYGPQPLILAGGTPASFFLTNLDANLPAYEVTIGVQYRRAVIS